METGQKEVAYHRASELREIDWKFEEISSCIDYLADFKHEFHDIREDAGFIDCLTPDSYRASQALGQLLLTTGSAGVVYPSVRHSGRSVYWLFPSSVSAECRGRSMVTITFVKAEMTAVTIES